MPADTRAIASRFEGCVATGTRLVDRVVMGVYDDALREVGLRSTQLTMLVVIASSDRPTAAAIAGAMAIDQTTLSRNLVRLEEASLVRRLDSDDARERPLQLTRKGERAIERALPIWEDCQRRIRELLGKDLASRLASAASRLGGGGS